ncbi:alkyl hydroperoxide reductase [Veronia nyctiphanis]|uniref:Alkyl hydroperoxide reductase n=1 Tax=Veronia nyctiphanis TaxID=1278244 RepID=A0A4Q0YQS2_9GAMM|nr:redoxin family protein [Veronia nyctiphanis]RXJ72414.1 alkyl hydroperoxide reductase [Veronia nyctiphanis]
MDIPKLSKATELVTSEWINTDAPLSIGALRGKVVVIYAFQMLCPACVSHGLPQIKKVQQFCSEADVQVIGIHTVFEHHDVMTADALKTFAYEYRLTFPIAIDQASNVGPIPETMLAYRLQGTPSLVIIDKEGFVRFQHLGIVDDLPLGSLIGHLVAEQSDETAIANESPSPTQNETTLKDENLREVICNDEQCEIKR